jgi:phosphoribosylcarboxyaminoimidazole (NCAIR) mutase
MLANENPELAAKLTQFRDEQRRQAMNMKLPPET